MSAILREYFRVPREDRAVYLRPSSADLAAMVEANRRLVASYAFDVAGRPWPEFRAVARAEAVALARAYARRWGFGLEREPDAALPLVVTGHQPQPVHPGVWFKHFVAGHLASAVGGAAINLTVDNDEAHGQALRFPVRAPAEATGDAVHAVEVRLADDAGGAAFEEQPSSALRSEAAGEAIDGLPPPCVEPFRRWWRHVAGAARDAASLGEALAVARWRMEEELGLRNLELPVSHLADGEAFRLLVAEMLGRPDEVFAAHNASLAEYRRAYRERSPAQPVPDLARDGPRLELPLWVWRPGEPRRRLWVEPRGNGLALFADRDPMATIGLRAASGRAGSSAVAEVLKGLREQGWKIRPRALAMTLFVRLAVGDVFIHGLGGALYDKVTDAMIERLFGVRPPGLILASCTVRLPLEAYPAVPRDLERARRRVRDWRHNPDRIISETTGRRGDVQALVGEKWRLIRERDPTREGRRRAYQRVHAINETLAAVEPDGRADAAREVARLHRHLRWNAILQNREYPCWFHSAQGLAAFYREALAG
ncbi:MAG TPA: hypothetical protein VM431_13875 [Phycisphaerae bacterium]|nr:hypothetical protein [Phycisphaerae bacterium]